jgi:hypothetical protein
MTIKTKMIIPLVEPRLHPELINTDIGFVNGYLSDCNRPFLDNHVFLLYRNIPFYVDNLLVNMPTFYNKYNVRYKGIYYTEYAFIRGINNKEDTNKIMHGIPEISSIAATSLMYFYRGDETYNYIHYHKPIPPEQDTLPISDYVPKYSEQLDTLLAITNID